MTAKKPDLGTIALKSLKFFFKKTMSLRGNKLISRFHFIRVVNIADFT